MIEWSELHGSVGLPSPNENSKTSPAPFSRFVTLMPTLTFRWFEYAGGFARIGSLIGIWKLAVPTKSGRSACAMLKVESQSPSPCGLTQTLPAPTKSPIEPRSLEMSEAPSPSAIRLKCPACSPVCGPSRKCRRIVPPRLALPSLMKRPNGPRRALKLRLLPAALAVRSRCVSWSPDPVLRKKLFCVPVSAEPSTLSSEKVIAPPKLIVYWPSLPETVAAERPARPRSAAR